MKLTEEQKAKAAKLFVGGKTLRAIAKQFETNVHIVQSACIDALGDEQYRRVAGKHRNRDDKKSLPHKDIAERNERLIADYKQGVSVIELAVAYHIGLRQVLKIIGGSVGLKPYSMAKIRVLDENFLQVAEMIARKASVGEIADKFGVPYNLSYYWLCKNVSEKILKEKLGINGLKKKEKAG